MTQRQVGDYMQRERAYLTLVEMRHLHDMIQSGREAEAYTTIKRLVSERKTYNEARGKGA